MSRLLFLDFDGVLHPVDSSIYLLGNFCWLSHLAELLRPWPDVQVVVHSSLRYEYTEAELRTFLGELGPRFAGTAPRLPREIAIQSVLQANKGRIDAHVVLDDDSTEFKGGRLNLILCKPDAGISATDVQDKLRAWLFRTASGGPASRIGHKTPRGYGKNVLYLDFDGVLHHDDVHYHPRRGAYLFPQGYKLFEYAGLLDELLRPFPDLRIVLSTSWVRQYGCYGAAKRLPSGLRTRVVGATFHSRMDEHLFLQESRGMQVWRDTLRRKPRDWFALDDDQRDWPAWCQDRYVRTNEALGVSEPGAAVRIEAQLRRMYGLDQGSTSVLNGPPGP